MKTILRRVGALLLLLAVLGLLAGCGMDLNEQYETAQLYLGMKEYDAAIELFSSLGGYRDSEQYVLYCHALQALDEVALSRAGQDFYNLNTFKLSSLYYDYVTARQLELEGSLYEAQESYLLLGSFLDAAQRYDVLGNTIPEHEFTSAKTLYDIGEYEKALAAFMALEPYGDSSEMAKLCNEAIGTKKLDAIEKLLASKKYEEGFAELDRLNIGASTALNQGAQTLKAKYQALVYEQAASEANVTEKKKLYGYILTYKDAREKATALDGIATSQNAQGNTYALFGGLLYRIIQNSQGRAVLLCETIADIMPVNLEGEIYAGFEKSSLKTYLNGAFMSSLTQSEKEAVLSITLPDAALARSLPVDTLMAAVPDKLKAKNPLTSSLGNGVWWLSDAGTLANSQMIVYYNGVIYDKGLPANDLRTGIRPLITLDTARYPFKSGTGTLNDPMK